MTKENIKELTAPLSDDVIASLKAGDMVLLSGKIITARDAAHKKISELLEAGTKLSEENLKLLDSIFTKDKNGKQENQTVFYAGPAPAKPDRVIGSVGPTTAGRMDLYAPLLISMGMKVMIGKGLRAPAVVEAIIKHGGIYFAAIGGAAALMAKCVKSSHVIAFEELGTEAVRELLVEKLPLVVAIDSQGNNIYEQGRREFQR